MWIVADSSAWRQGWPWAVGVPPLKLHIFIDQNDPKWSKCLHWTVIYNLASTTPQRYEFQICEFVKCSSVLCSLLLLCLFRTNPQDDLAWVKIGYRKMGCDKRQKLTKIWSGHVRSLILTPARQIPVKNPHVVPIESNITIESRQLSMIFPMKNYHSEGWTKTDGRSKKSCPSRAHL